MIFPRPVIVHENGCMSFIRLGRTGKPVASDPCQFQDEYRKIDYEGEKWGAHRLSYHLNVEEIPRQPPERGVDNILHTCDHKWCIAPEHVYKGDAKQNAIDNATRNVEWRKNRSEAQKKLGFPKVSEDGRKRMAEANRKRMKDMWSNNPEAARKQRKI